MSALLDLRGNYIFSSSQTERHASCVYTDMDDIFFAVLNYLLFCMGMKNLDSLPRIEPRTFRKEFNLLDSSHSAVDFVENVTWQLVMAIDTLNTEMLDFW